MVGHRESAEDWLIIVGDQVPDLILIPVGMILILHIKVTVAKAGVFRNIDLDVPTSLKIENLTFGKIEYQLLDKSCNIVV